MHARFRLGEVVPQLLCAMLDELDKDFVLGLEVQVEGAETNVGFGGDVGDARLMVSLARDDAFGRLNQIDPRLFTPAIEPILTLTNLSRDCCHDRESNRKMNRKSITILDSKLNLYS
jgi:hypothetical protein